MHSPDTLHIYGKMVEKVNIFEKYIYLPVDLKKVEKKQSL